MGAAIPKQMTGIEVRKPKAVRESPRLCRMESTCGGIEVTDGRSAAAMSKSAMR
ncbi:MAG: hypothetical protein JW384_00663 [Nitrosomonadaceae bacterium]|nr:hypothetical protein [Nitrosomonadaceae bacterium]